MSERCENRLDAVRIGLPPIVDVADQNVVDTLEANPTAAQASKFEVPKGSSSPLPLDLPYYPDPFPSFGWERLLPYELDNPRGLRPYEIYLEEFYNIHKNPASVAADAPRQCLLEENILKYCWGRFSIYSFPSEIALLSEGIKERMLQFIVNEGGESEHPFVFDAAACISEEAKLMVRGLKRGFDLSNEEYIMSHEIRQVAYELVMFQGEWSAEIAATLLGIKKEAELLRNNMNNGSLESIETSMQIRRFAIEFLQYKLDPELGTSEGNNEASVIIDAWTDSEDDSWESS